MTFEWQMLTPYYKLRCTISFGAAEFNFCVFDRNYIDFRVEM